MNIAHYTCIGSVRPDCGVHHRTREAADRCLHREGRQIQALGGGAFSDRAVKAVTDEGNAIEPPPVWDPRLDPYATLHVEDLNDWRTRVED